MMRRLRAAISGTVFMYGLLKETGPRMQVAVACAMAAATMSKVENRLRKAADRAAGAREVLDNWSVAIVEADGG